MAKSFKIVVPTDFSEDSRAVLDWVRKLNKEQAAEVHCVTVVQEPIMYMPVMAGTAMASLPSLDELRQMSQVSLDSFASKYMSDFASAPITKVLTGRPADEITAYAKKIGAGMIVIATRGHSRIAHALLGSTTENVLRQAECPVLTIRS